MQRNCNYHIKIKPVLSSLSQVRGQFQTWWRLKQSFSPSLYLSGSSRLQLYVLGEMMSWMYSGHKDKMQRVNQGGEKWRERVSIYAKSPCWVQSVYNSWHLFSDLCHLNNWEVRLCIIPVLVHFHLFSMLLMWAWVLHPLMVDLVLLKWFKKAI